MAKKQRATRRVTAESRKHKGKVTAKRMKKVKGSVVHSR